MSQPKRYSLVASYYCSDAKMKAFEDGEFVRQADYAALQAENERLRKAGDVLMEVYCESSFYELEPRDWKTIPSVADWLAAKEGRDAK